MNYCVVCGQRIWPWQRFGFRVLPDGAQEKWHADCKGAHPPTRPSSGSNGPIAR